MLIRTQLTFIYASILTDDIDGFQRDNLLIFFIGTATPKSPTVRSPTYSGSPMGSAHNSDTEMDPKTPGETSPLLF